MAVDGALGACIGWIEWLIDVEWCSHRVRLWLLRMEWVGFKVIWYISFMDFGNWLVGFDE